MDEKKEKLYIAIIDTQQDIIKQYQHNLEYWQYMTVFILALVIVCGATVAIAATFFVEIMELLEIFKKKLSTWYYAKKKK